MTQKSESVAEQTELLIHAGFAADAALKLEGFEWPSVSTRTELVKAIAKSVTLKLAEEAEQEGREQQALSTSEGIRRGDGLLTAAAWLREKAR